MLTSSNLRRNRTTTLRFKMPDMLSQQGVQESLPQIVCRSSSRNTYTQCSKVANDKASDEEVHEVQY
jgi:hypothetical protein